jgi:UDP:flavonoid glycosyltransferase YjiC (YdhE family)
MKIGIQTWGSDGDIRPLAALAAGLKAAGNDVTLAITSVDSKEFSLLAESLGIRVIHAGYVDKKPEEIEPLAYAIIETRNIIKQFRIILDIFFWPLLGEMQNASKRLSEENDLLIGHFIMYPLQAAAERAGRPYVTVTLNHSAIPSKHVPPVGLPDLGRWLNPLWWKLVRVLSDGLLKPPINELRQRETLPPVGSFIDVWESKILNLIAVSPALCRKQQDWPDYQHVCGFFNLPEQAEEWTMPDGLARFLESGPPPVFMTFGSMTLLDTAVGLTETTRLMVDAARLAKCRAIIQSRWEDVDDIPEHPDIYRIGRVPHRHIFPNCSAVVHHGGSGTTQQATLHGCPSIIVEHLLDQVMWGLILKKLGVAPRLLHRRSVKPEKLARVIKAVIGNKEMKTRAEELGRQMRGEDGVAYAVRLVEERFSK